MKNKTVQSSLILLLTAFIWGMGFVSQRFGMDLVGPFFFAGMRTLFAALTILLVIAVTGVISRRNSNIAGPRGVSGDGDGSSEGSETGEAKDIKAGTTGAKGWKNPWLVKGGIVCGTVLFLGQGLQQAGIVFSTASKAGFLTALYIVLVPVLGLFVKKHTHWNTWVSIPIAAVGLYFLSITAEFTILPGDLIMLIGAVMWAGHILVTDHYVQSITQNDILKLVTIQFIMCSILSFICVPIADMKLVPIPLSPDIIVQVLPALLYAGCISAGVGFTLQAIGQRHISPAAAGLILSLEAVFGAIGGALILGERLSPRELLGCAFMFVAVIFAQIPVRGKKDVVDSGESSESASDIGGAAIKQERK